VSTYKTISKGGESQYRVLGSRHIGSSYPVSSEEEIKSIIDALWKEHHSATHICYAWRLGWDKSRFRANDDGEPGGTAGKPILGQIQSFDLTNILICVIRYYGGTKLGTGGLIDAYKTTSKLTIEASIIEERVVKDHYSLSFSYDQMPVIMKLLKELNMEKLAANFESECSVEFLLDMNQEGRLNKGLEDMEGITLTHIGRR